MSLTQAGGSLTSIFTWASLFLFTTPMRSSASWPLIRTTGWLRPLGFLSCKEINAVRADPEQPGAKTIAAPHAHLFLMMLLATLQRLTAPPSLYYDESDGSFSFTNFPACTSFSLLVTPHAWPVTAWCLLSCFQAPV